MTNQDGFYRLWQAVSGLSGLDNFPIDRLDDEDFVLAEAMVGEGLNRLMEFKTQLLNAKSKLQTPDLQRGVLPQTEEGKESVCVETVTDKTEADRETLSALFRSKELNGRNYPHLHGEGESYITEKTETDKPNIGETQSADVRLQRIKEGFSDLTSHLQRQSSELLKNRI